MTEEEIDYVAQELAKVGGVSWYPGRTAGGLLRSVSARYRDRARVAIAALDRLRASRETVNASASTEPGADTARGGVDLAPGDKPEVGAIVVYRPLGDQRAITCKITQVDDNRVYLVPCPRPDIGWVALEAIAPVVPHDAG